VPNMLMRLMLFFLQAKNSSQIFLAKVNDVNTQFAIGIPDKGKRPKEKINPMTKPRDTVPLRAISEDL
jgi:hypothetical protein